MHHASEQTSAHHSKTPMPTEEEKTPIKSGWLRMLTDSGRKGHVVEMIQGSASAFPYLYPVNPFL